MCDINFEDLLSICEVKIETIFRKKNLHSAAIRPKQTAKNTLRNRRAIV